jgi:hypothetical protein
MGVLGKKGVLAGRAGQWLDSTGAVAVRQWRLVDPFVVGVHGVVRICLVGGSVERPLSRQTGRAGCMQMPWE